MRILFYYFVGCVISFMLTYIILRIRQVSLSKTDIIKILLYSLFSWYWIWLMLYPALLEKIDRYYLKRKVRNEQRNKIQRQRRRH